ncbi:MAG: GNAT family N-acetyltransferase [Massilia sp.]
MKPPAIAAIETPRLLLRPFTIDDAEAWLPLIALPEIVRYTGETPTTTIEGAREVLRSRPLHDYAAHGFGRMACIERASGRLVGFSGLKFVAHLGEVDIGYRFLPDCWGKGYATESASVLMAAGRREHGLQRIVGQVDPANHASVRVLVKLGLRFEKEFEDEGELIHLYASDC